MKRLKLKPESRLKAEYRSPLPPPKPASRRMPTSASRKPIRTEGITEDGRRCTFYLDADGNEVTENGDPIVYDLDDDFDCSDETPAFAAPVERRQTKKLQAAELLRKWLKDGPVAVTEIKERALAANISWSTIDKARYELGLIAIKDTGYCGGWLWKLPK